MVTKEAAMSFSQFGYPYNATSQVRHFAFFTFLPNFSVNTHLFLVRIFFFSVTRVSALFSHKKHLWMTDCFDSTDSYFFSACCFCCWSKYRYTRTRVQLHWIMNELTCFSDDNRDECHLSRATRGVIGGLVTHAVQTFYWNDWVRVDKLDYFGGAFKTWSEPFSSIWWRLLRLVTSWKETKLMRGQKLLSWQSCRPTFTSII